MPEDITRVERRKRPDFLVKWVKWTGLISWCILIPGLYFVEKARPPMETFFDRLLEIETRQFWDVEYIDIAFYLMAALFILSMVSIIINSRRLKRKGDRLSPSLSINAALSMIGIAVYFIFFNSV